MVMMARGAGHGPQGAHPEIHGPAIPARVGGLVGRAARGVAAAGLQLAAGELVAALLPGARSPLGGLGKATIDHTPGPLVDATVALVEDKDKPLLRGGLLAGFLAAGVAAGAASPTRRRAGRAYGAGILLGTGALGALAGASRPAAAPVPTVLANAAGAAAGALALHLQPSPPSGPPGRPGQALRQMAGMLALTAAAMLAARAAVERRGRRPVVLPTPSRPLPPPPHPSRFAVAGLSPVVTPVADFYVTDVAFPTPRVDADSWRLRVGGLVERELEFSYRQLLGLGLVELDATLVCVHNPVGGRRIGTARWLGVPVGELLALVGVRPGAELLLARSADGFTAAVPLALAGGSASDAVGGLVVVGMNGAPLTRAHGFPARLLLPGIYGYNANTKWLTELQLTTVASARDYWTVRGWPRRPARVWPGSRIDIPEDHAYLPQGLVTVAGVAWAPPAGVCGVQVRIDGGRWRAAELGPELAPTAWRQWRLDWQATPGAHRLQVRAEGRQGLQPTRQAPPYPAGATGLHTVSVRVVPAPGASGGRAHPAPAMQRRVTQTRARIRLAADGLAAWRAAARMEAR